jgi:hypothetical protein
MSDLSTSPQFLLLFRNTQHENRLSPGEMREAMVRLIAWLDRWTERGAIKGAQPLASEGKTISGARQRVVADGPYAEAKEAIGGYVLIEAADFDEAMAIAGEWPMLDYDGIVEVRPVLAQCPAMAQVKEELAAAGA